MEDLQGRISLRYEGGLAASGQMGHYEAAAAIIAFGDFMGIVSRSAFGDGVSTETRVTGISAGCISLDFAIHLGGMLTTIVSGPVTLPDFWDLLKQSIEAWRHLKGEPPAKVEHQADRVAITNRDGVVQHFHNSTVVVIGSDKAAECAQQFVGKVLAESAERLAIVNHADGGSVDVRRDESGYFTDVRPEQELAGGISRAWLVIESAVFKEGNKWRFSDGSNAFSATIEDVEFLHQVDTGARFGKGDILVCDVRVVQRRRGTRLSSEHYVTKVVDHIVQRQLDMLPDPDRG